MQLVDADTGANIWAERFDKRIADQFLIQDDIRKKIISALSVKLSEEENKRIQGKYSASLEAYDYFLQGQASLIKRSSAEDNLQAQKLLQTAIDIDPGFARALGRWHWLMRMRFDLAGLMMLKLKLQQNPHWN